MNMVIHSITVRIVRGLMQNKKNRILRFLYYRNPLARQHVDAAAFQSECCCDGVRISRHGCHPEQRLFDPVPVHLAYLRKEHVWFDNFPVSVVHFTTTV